MKVKLHVDQKGMASIMFAMFLVLGISLLAIGFATLVRNDQRQALDKTLSNQAQYAAESAINKVQAYLKSPAGAGSVNLSDCGGANQKPVFTTGIEVTCLTWNPSPSELNHANIDTTPWSVPIIPNAGSINSLVITWTADYAAVNSGNTGNLVLTGNVPTLRIVASGSDIANTSTVTYVNPKLNGPQSVPNTGSGQIANGNCTNSGTKTSCTVTLNGPWGNNGYLAVSALNGTATNVNVKMGSVTGGATGFMNAQAVITANAKSQDVSKRLVAYVALPTTTWQPGFVASADALCKNYALGISGNAGVPPNNPATNISCPQ